MIKRYCLNCGCQFQARPYKVAQGQARFCSHACNASYNHRGKPKPQSRMNIIKAIEAHRGKPAWNRNKIVLTCQYCGEVFEVQPARKYIAKYCSRECFSKHKSTIRGQNHPLFTRIPKLCQWCNKEVWIKPAKFYEFRFCSRQCLGAWVKSHFHKPSSPEKLVAEALNEMKIPFQSEYRLGRYSCDFALPQYSIVIEVDGDYWHSIPSRKKLDKIKDKYIREQGWQVIRFKESNIHTNLTNCLIKLHKHISLFNYS